MFGKRKSGWLILTFVAIGVVTLLSQLLVEFMADRIDKVWENSPLLALPVLAMVAIMGIIVVAVYQVRTRPNREEPTSSELALPPPPRDRERGEFVGHEELLRELKDMLLVDGSLPRSLNNLVRKTNERLLNKRASSGEQPRLVLQLLPGVGKSEIATQLGWDEEVHKHFDQVLWADLGKEPDISAILSKWAKALGVAQEGTDHMRTIDDWRSTILAAIGERRVFMLVDDVWKAGHARDFVFPVSQAPNCAYLFTTRKPEVAADLIDKNFHKTVPELNEPNSLKLLRQEARGVIAEPPQQEAKDLAREVGGLPLALVLVGRYLRHHSLHEALEKYRQADKLLSEPLENQHERDRKLPEGEEHTLRTVIDMSFQELDEESMRTLRKLSIFRPKPHTFTKVAALEVSDTSEETLKKLVDYGLLEKLIGTKEISGEESQSDALVHYRLQRTIADAARERLSAQEAEELHRRAASYYHNLLSGYEESQDVKGYQRWYLYEDPDWQSIKSGWLFHLAHTQDRERARLDFARIYFDAFWWWGYYLDYPFCEQLLSEWKQTQMSLDDDEEWLRLLREFHSSYLTGYEQLLKGWEQTQTLTHNDRQWLRKFHGSVPLDGYDRKGEGNWGKVQDALLGLRPLAGLNGQVTELDDDRRHLRAITDVFLAHALRYQHAEDEANRYYEEALDLFKQGGADDAWNIPWVLCEQGDLYMKQGRNDDAMLEKALRKCEESLQRAREEGEGEDREIIALSHRVRADVFWQRNELNKAFGNYAFATFYAYAFHGYEGPDHYTVAFHREMVERTLVRLLTLWHDEDQMDKTLEFSACLHDFWVTAGAPTRAQSRHRNVKRLWEKNCLEDLAAYLFPSEPPKDLKESDEYVRQINEVYEKMDGRIEANGVC
jgi:NB-ARC domain/MalT-like TPR region